jgi:hypothetical protein
MIAWAIRQWLRKISIIPTICSISVLIRIFQAKVPFPNHTGSIASSLQKLWHGEPASFNQWITLNAK